MATYKVLQDIEAEDKLLGPLTLKQFIFAGIAAICLYLSFLSITKRLTFLLVIFLPPALVAGFLAWPWSRDQPTEIWLMAKIRFMLKPRRRIWDQDGMQELVTITAPKKIEQHLTDNLSQTEVKSRLRALAETIDSRGWAVKNVNVNLSAQPGYGAQGAATDRLIDLSTLPQEVSNLDIAAADDILDERSNPTAQHLDQMITAATQEHRQELLDHVKQLREHPDKPAAAPAANPQVQDLWFMQTPQTPGQVGYTTFNSQVVAPGLNQPQASAAPAAKNQDEQALLAQLHPDNNKPAVAYGHMKVISPLGQAAAQKPVTPAQIPKPAAPPAPDPTILSLAGNDDLNVATIAREANKKRPPEDEVVISLR